MTTAEIIGPSYIMPLRQKKLMFVNVMVFVKCNKVHIVVLLLDNVFSAVEEILKSRFHLNAAMDSLPSCARKSFTGRESCSGMRAGTKALRSFDRKTRRGRLTSFSAKEASIPLHVYIENGCWLLY